MNVCWSGVCVVWPVWFGLCDRCEMWNVVSNSKLRHECVLRGKQCDCVVMSCGCCVSQKLVYVCVHSENVCVFVCEEIYIFV